MKKPPSQQPLELQELEEVSERAAEELPDAELPPVAHEARDRGDEAGGRAVSRWLILVLIGAAIVVAVVADWRALLIVPFLALFHALLPIVAGFASAEREAEKTVLIRALEDHERDPDQPLQHPEGAKRVEVRELDPEPEQASPREPSAERQPGRTGEGAA